MSYDDDMRDASGDWIKIGDINDPTTLTKLETFALNAAFDAREQVCNFLTEHGCSAEQIGRMCDQVELELLKRWHRDLAAMQRDLGDAV